MAVLASADVAGLRFNLTPSMPRGLWQVVMHKTPLRRGEVVTLCPPDTAPIRLGAARGYIPAGRCPGGYEPLVKPIAATAGDRVTVSAAGVTVNGQTVPGTVPLAHDSAGRVLPPFPAGAYPVPQGDVWLLSGHDPRSFDSRYFGPVPAANVLGLARPVWVANVAPVTLEAIVRVESGGNPLALHVNRLAGPQPQPATVADAVHLADTYIRQGYSVDLGLMQVNSRNLAALGTSIEQVLDPCSNIRGGAAILTANYAEAVRSRGEGQAALQAALSAYNTGDFYRGIGNGYVAKYYAPNGVPALASGIRQASVTAASVQHTAPPAPPNPYTAETQIYVREATNVHVE
jgi:type IV secretion system protein VirB1